MGVKIGPKSLTVDRIEPVLFKMPELGRFKYDSFDNLVHLMDELQRYEMQVEQCLRRVERMYHEIEGDPEFFVFKKDAGGVTHSMPIDKYLMVFEWDEQGYDRSSKTISDIMHELFSNVNRLDSDGRHKMSNYKVKLGVQQHIEKNSTLFDLVDVFHPDLVKADTGSDSDFVETTHLTTVVVNVQPSEEKSFFDCYERLLRSDEEEEEEQRLQGHERLTVVPRSAKKFEMKAKDGTSYIRVIVFRHAELAFTRKCRSLGYAPTDFKFSEKEFEASKKHRADVARECEEHGAICTEFCKTAWSEMMIDWVHIKVMKLFVECTMRYGDHTHGTPFVAFLLQPKLNCVSDLIKVCDDVLGHKGTLAHMSVTDEEEEGEEVYHSFVLVNLTPFCVEKGANKKKPINSEQAAPAA